MPLVPMMTGLVVKVMLCPRLSVPSSVDWCRLEYNTFLSRTGARLGLKCPLQVSARQAVLAVFFLGEIIVFVAQVTTCLWTVWLGLSLVLVLIVDSQFFSNLGFSLRFGERMKLRACVRPEHSGKSKMVCAKAYRRSE